MTRDAGGLEWVHLRTRFGRFSIGAGRGGVASAGFGIRAPPGPGPSVHREVLEVARREMVEYLAGKRREFSSRLDLSAGTAFQRRVWGEMTRIPFGQVASYGELARRVGKRGAARAVGQVCRSNPIGVLVPCHRVVASDGIGGFGGPARAVGLKRRLLRHEGVDRY